METLIDCKLHFEDFFNIITCQKSILPVYSFICRPSRNNRMKLQSFFEKGQYIQSNDPRKRMIGGNPADPREHPWQVLVVLSAYNYTTHKYHFYNKCGGTLISDQWVITAHYCVLNIHHSWVQVVLGGHVYPPAYQQSGEVTTTGFEYVRSLEKIVLHPNGGLLAYDIALLKMSSRITFSQKIFPACVPGPDYKFQITKTVIATGWGWTKSLSTKTYPTVLQELELFIDDRAYCEYFLKTGCSAGNMLAITSIF